MGVSLTVGDAEQFAVRCVHVTRCHVVPLRRPVDRGVVLDVQLLNNTIGFMSPNTNV